MFLRKFVNRTQNSSKKSKPFWKLRFGRESVVHRPFNDGRLKDIQYSISMALDTSFHIWFIMALHCKMWQLFYYKMRQTFITKRISFFITKCDSYYKMRRFYYEVRSLLQIAAFVTNCESTKYVFWKFFKNSIKLLASPFLEMFKTFTHWETGHWKDTPRALERHSGIWALKALEHLGIQALEQSDTWKGLRYSGTQVLRYLDTRGTLFRSLMNKESLVFSYFYLDLCSSKWLRRIWSIFWRY